MKLTIIGCTGSFPGPGSPASCYLVTAFDGERDWKILLDMGSGALGVLQRYVDIKDLDGIFISHLHPDHCMDLCGMHVAIHWDPNGWNRDRMLVWGPEATADRIATAYGLPLDPGMHEDYDFQHWVPREPVHLGPFKITPVPVLHPIEEAYALRVEATEPMVDGTLRTSVLTYSGDTDSCDGLIEAALDSDMFLCEAAFEEGRDDGINGVHLTGKRAGIAATQAGAERLLLTHIPVWTDINTVVNEAKEVYSGGIAVAVSGVTYGVWSGSQLGTPKSLPTAPVSIVRPAPNREWPGVAST
ncbi:MBL fold metallo-hydrolase [Paeniglutamicibacter cryotolerans]|uniref:Ribonuclease BN (tRNA processing enzyme) n=1 Tax=Paeniglutamicibacter cryotolerans TaxID=670079 RepID=A0A839QKM9_9MICC|nr:MBL fold metallo-hydrolase [Paeniglutamicibacter cryotolerans]MBB2996407.1 ribonuclease BN (tRNA processing enzyme) [Paeniglutamicibacter cryotolerans]